MSKARQGDQKTYALKHDGTTVGAVLAIATLTPILLGAATIAYHWPTAPLNISLAVFVIVWLEARNERRVARLIEHMDANDEEWRKLVHKLRTEIRDAAEETRLDTLKAEVQTRSADLRTLRSGE